MWSYLLRLTALALLTLLGFSAYMLFTEERYLFFPEQHVAHTPAAAGLPFEDVDISPGQGVKLHGWFIPAHASAPVVLQLHGNAGNIGDRLPLYARWHAMGLSVLALDYRGYGRSSGKPSEVGFYGDADAAWHYLTAKRGIGPKQIIIDGRSIGAAVAAHLASMHANAAGLVLETPFSSTAAMAAYHYPFFLLRPLIRNQFDTVAHMGKVKMPLLIIAARDDAIAPPFMAAEILAAAMPPKRLVTLPGGHNDFDRISEAAYQATWRQWLAAIGMAIKEKPAPETGIMEKETGAP